MKPVKQQLYQVPAALGVDNLVKRLTKELDSQTL